MGLGFLQRLQQHWFNVSPDPTWRGLVDRHGEKFWFKWDDEAIPTLVLVHRGRQVGHANILWYPNGCELADIVLVRPEFRRRGLGAVMMREIVAHARLKNMAFIAGTIIPGAGGEPREWYRRQGFQVDGNRLKLDLEQTAN